MLLRGVRLLRLLLVVMVVLLVIRILFHLLKVVLEQEVLSNQTEAIQVRHCSFLTQVIATVPMALPAVTARKFFTGPPRRVRLRPLTATVYLFPMMAALLRLTGSELYLFVVFVPDIYR